MDLFRKILKIFLPRKRKAKLRTSNSTLKLNSNNYIWLRKLSSYAYHEVIVLLLFLSFFEKNNKYLLTINLFTPLLQRKLFWRNNITFTRKCTNRRVNFMHNILFIAVRLDSEAAVWRGSEKHVLRDNPWNIPAEKFIF